MNKNTLVLLLIGVFSGVLNGQSIEPINTVESQIVWEGTKLFGFGGHAGTIDFKEGHLLMQGQKIVGGEFVIDMHSMQSSEKDTWVESFMEHLKGEDFFDVNNNPMARIVFTDVKYADEWNFQITADLTINCVTNSVFFVASYNEAKTQIETRLKIDRTEYGITYKSQGKTSIKNEIISDAIAFNITVQL